MVEHPQDVLPNLGACGTASVCLFNFYVDNLDIFEGFVIAICLGLLYCDDDIITFCNLQTALPTMDNSPVPATSIEPS